MTLRISLRSEDVSSKYYNNVPRAAVIAQGGFLHVHKRQSNSMGVLTSVIIIIIINKYCAEPLHIEYKHRKDTTKYNQAISSVKLMLD